jgi:hypothetical protein
MRDFIIQNGWLHHKTGCPCHGSPRYYKNPSFPDYKIILKGGKAALRYFGVDKFRAGNTEELKQKMMEYGFITDIQNVAAQPA